MIIKCNLGHITQKEFKHFDCLINFIMWNACDIWNACDMLNTFHKLNEVNLHLQSCFKR